MTRRAAVVLAVLILLGSNALGAQGDAAPSPVAATRPFAIGERAQYEVRFGKLRVGEATMEISDGPEIRGRETWHTKFHIRGGVPFYRVNDLLESWIDRRDFVSLRYRENLEEGRRDRERTFEIFPERATFREDTMPELPSISNPLDEGSFFYYVRTIPLVVGETYSLDRYFRPDRNPVVVKVLGTETVKVPAGTFETIVIQPLIKAKGIFSEKGEARIWLTNDHRRMMVQMKTKTKIGSLNLHLKSFRPTAEPSK